MSHEALFSLVGLLSFSGWGVLLASPWMPVWSDRIAGVLVPSLLAALYLAVAIADPPAEGGFGTLAEVLVLFDHPGAVLSGWIHFLAFDLVVGAWMCRTARRDGLPFGLVLPCLPVVFLLGPAGFLLFLGLRAGFERVRRATRG